MPTPNLPSDASPRDGRARAVLSRLRAHMVGNVLIVGLALLMIYFSLASSAFWTISNLREIALEGAILSIVAVPEALIILSGFVDLSVGSVLGLGGVVAGLVMTQTHAGTLVALLAGMGAGAAVGVINGVLCTYVGMSAILVTLGTLTAVRGTTLLVTSLPIFGFGAGFDFLGVGQVAGIPVPVLFAAAAFLIGGVYLGLTPGGRHVYAIGVNREAAYLSGISIRRLPFLLFILTGATAAFGGVLFAARLDSAPPGTLGVGFELTVLTAVLLGGVAFEGGRGSIFGVLLGVLFLGVLQNGLTLMNVTDFWQQVASGCALIVAAGLDIVSSRARVSSGGRRLRRISLRPAQSPPAGAAARR
ncbi:MAG TPA: ABC transporter permease [Streptosporangiaceae bacterium]|nr:ABC transporter permease [Streptosporangiaceae bacterium]